MHSSLQKIKEIPKGHLDTIEMGLLEAFMAVNMGVSKEGGKGFVLSAKFEGQNQWLDFGSN